MRTSTDNRIRGRRLQERRRRWFAEHPLCVTCNSAGRVREATELDHVIPLHKDGADDETNLQGLCAECHEAKTVIDMGYTQRQEIGLDGWPVP